MGQIAACKLFSKFCANCIPAVRKERKCAGRRNVLARREKACYFRKKNVQAGGEAALNIGMVVPYEDMGEFGVRIGQEIGIHVSYIVGESSNGVARARELIARDHVEAIVARNPVHHFLRRELDIPVISLDISSMDLLRAIRKIDPGKRVGFFHVDEDSEMYATVLQELQEITGHQIEIIRIFGDFNYDLKSRNYLGRKEYMQIRRCDALITSTPTTGKFYESVGKQVEYIGAEPYQIYCAIMNAVDSVNVRNREIQNTRLTELALNSTSDGFIVLNGDRVIMLNDNLCRLAGMDKETILHKSSQELMGRSVFLRQVLQTTRKSIVCHQNVQYSIFRRTVSMEKGEGEKLELISIINVPNIQRTETSIRKALDKRGFDAKWHFEDIVSHGSAIEEAIRKARQYAKAESNVLILGESGTGKEMFAQSIHNASSFAKGPFVAINCAALPESLLESELFGYEGGAFTGARKGGKTGLVELSHEGTLFLDEIGELPLALQAKLLRMIQERRITRVGGDRLIPVNNRLICATHRDLAQLVREKQFREDLYYRIDVLHVLVPPLRQRKESIPALVESLLFRLAQKRSYSVPELPAECLALLSTYDWPGNIRQLETFLERFLAANNDVQFHPEVFHSLFLEITETGGSAAEAAAPGHTPQGSVLIPFGTMEEMERELLLQTYHRCGENMQATARELKLGRSTVWRKLKELDAI